MVHLLNAHPKETDRVPSDFKELRSLCESFYWLKDNIFGIEFNSTDVIELIKHVKVRCYKPNQVVYLPGDNDQNLYFILRGKVAVGAESFKEQDDCTKIFKLTHAAPSFIKMSKKKSTREIKKPDEDKEKKQEEKVYFEGRLCKLTITEDVEEFVDGKV